MCWNGAAVRGRDWASFERERVTAAIDARRHLAKPAPGDLARALAARGDAAGSGSGRVRRAAEGGGGKTAVEAAASAGVFAVLSAEVTSYVVCLASHGAIQDPVRLNSLRLKEVANAVCGVLTFSLSSDSVYAVLSLSRSVALSDDCL